MSGNRNIYQSVLKELEYDPFMLEDFQFLIDSSDFTEEDRENFYAAAINAYPRKLQENWQNLSKIPEKYLTYDLCIIAITKNPNALKLIPVQFRDYELCLQAIAKDANLIKLIGNPQERPTLSLKDYESLCRLAVAKKESLIEVVHPEVRENLQVFLKYLMNIKTSWKSIEKIPAGLLYYEHCLAVVNQNKNPLPFIKNPESRFLLSKDEYEKVCLAVISRFPFAINDIYPEIMDEAFYKKAILKNKDVIEHIKDARDYDALYNFSLEQDFISFLDDARARQNLDEIIIYLSNNKNNPGLLRFLKKDKSIYKAGYLIDELILGNSIDSLEKYAEVIKNHTAVLNTDTGRLQSFQHLINLENNINKLNRHERSQVFSILSTKYNLPEPLNMLKGFFGEDAASEIKIIENMIVDKNPDVFLMLDLLMPFTKGFGKLQYNHALLTCAETADRKKYSFNPVILTIDNQDEYFEMLNEIKNSEVRERFCIVGSHWRTGDIQIKNNQVNILVTDSFGLDKEDKFYTKEALNEILQKFPDSAVIFFDKTKRQYSGFGCSVVSLDDLIHLFTVENFLPEKDLFQYFINQGKNNESIPLESDKNITIIPADLPLSLMRSMQDAKLKNQVIPSRKNEKDWMVNKKQQTALESVKGSFKTINNVERNMRLNEKLTRMARLSLAYLTKNSMSDVIQNMQKYTLDGFKQRFSKKVEPEKKPYQSATLFAKNDSSDQHKHTSSKQHRKHSV